MHSGGGRAVGCKTSRGTQNLESRSHWAETGPGEPLESKREVKAVCSLQELC